MFGRYNSEKMDPAPSYLENGRDSMTLRDEGVNPGAAITKTDLEKNMKKKEELEAGGSAEITEKTASTDDGESQWRSSTNAISQRWKLTLGETNSQLPHAALVAGRYAHDCRDHLPRYPVFGKHYLVKTSASELQSTAR